MKHPLSMATIAAVAALSIAGHAVATTYYVDGANGNDSSAGTSWGTARKTIAKGLALATSEGDEVVVAAGTYALTASLGMKAAGVTLRGATGDASDVILDCGGTSRAIYYNGGQNYPGCIFRDFTVQNAYSAGTYYSAAAIQVWGASYKIGDDATTLSNVVVRQCSVPRPQKTTIPTMSAAAVTLGHNAKLYDCIFEANTNVFGVGAVSLGTNAVVRGCRFDGNVLDDGGTETSIEFLGGALYAERGLDVSGCSFTSNKVRAARPYGGAVATGKSGAYSFTGCGFTNNAVETLGSYYDPAPSAGNYAGGGAVASRYVGNTTAATNIFRNCAFSGNVATGGNAALRGNTKGGALRTASAKFDIVDCVFTGNNSFSGGSAIHVGGRYGTGSANYPAGRDSVIDRCTFKANVVGSLALIAEGTGDNTSGALVGYGTGTSVRNCLFACNTNWFGCAAIANAYSTYTGVAFDNLTVVDNAGTLVASGVTRSYGLSLYPNAANALRLANCIAIGNHNVTNAAVNCIGGNTIVNDVSCYTEGADESNCYFQYTRLAANAETGIQKGSNPGFTDRANGDYTLIKESTCRNAGVNLEWMAGARDLRNHRKVPRINEGTVDIGCYEWYNPNADKPTVLTIR